MNNYTIYQLPPTLWAENHINMFHKDYSLVDFVYYCPVYRFETESLMSLDEIFEEFNLAEHENFAGHSLSVGDVVQINNKYFLCMMTGWKEIQFIH